MMFKCENYLKCVRTHEEGRKTWRGKQTLADYSWFKSVKQHGMNLIDSSCQCCGYSISCLWTGLSSPFLEDFWFIWKQFGKRFGFINASQSARLSGFFARDGVRHGHRSRCFFNLQSCRTRVSEIHQLLRNLRWSCEILVLPWSAVSKTLQTC